MVTAMTDAGNGGDQGIAFLVSAGIVYEIIAACCSSPQTAEINADKRSETLMKWVNLGTGQAGAFVLLACVFDRKHCKPILLGGLVAGTLLYCQYLHALDAGLKSSEPGSED